VATAVGADELTGAWATRRADDADVAAAWTSAIDGPLERDQRWGAE